MSYEAREVLAPDEVERSRQYQTVYDRGQALVFDGGAGIGLRFLCYCLIGYGTGKVQSPMLAAILTIVGFQVCLIGLMADLVRLNRKMLEEALYRVRRMELSAESQKQEIGSRRRC